MLIRKSDFCLNKHKTRAVCKQVLSAETPFQLKQLLNSASFFVLLEEILQKQICKHMAKVGSAFAAQFCSSSLLASDNGDIYSDGCVSAKGCKLGREGVGNEHLCLLQVGMFPSKGRKTGTQGKRNPGTK